jgi:hypothetical protein
MSYLERPATISWQPNLEEKVPESGLNVKLEGFMLAQ